MILYERPSDVACIGQAAHAWVSGRLARHWGNADFVRPEPFEDVCLGATLHDVGMTDWDRRPERDPETGLPQSFLAMDPAVHLKLWENAPHKALSQSPYAALLVSMHGHALFAGKRDRPGVQGYLDRCETYQRGLIDALNDTPANARRNQRLVWAVDYLALAALTGWTPSTVLAPDHDLTVRAVAPLHLSVDPWPFDLPGLTIPYDARRLTQRAADQDELDRQLEHAPWIRLDVTWSPA